MSLLPIIYTSLLIFASLATTVLIVSYIIFKAKGGGPKPAVINNVQHVKKQQTRSVNTINTHIPKNYSQRNQTPVRNQNDLMFYKKPISTNSTYYNNKKTSVPRIQIINKPTEKKVVVVRRQAVPSTYDSNNFLGYYHENEKGVLFQA
ncbi:MAG: hypothetical protein KJ571_17405 [Bacteroidetes bacterium]|nr:hypothetical protein [Bacteroidota bacterium]